MLYQPGGRGRLIPEGRECNNLLRHIYCSRGFRSSSQSLGITFIPPNFRYLQNTPGCLSRTSLSPCVVNGQNKIFLGVIFLTCFRHGPLQEINCISCVLAFPRWQYKHTHCRPCSTGTSICSDESHAGKLPDNITGLEIWGIWHCFVLIRDVQGWPYPLWNSDCQCMKRSLNPVYSSGFLRQDRFLQNRPYLQALMILAMGFSPSEKKIIKKNVTLKIIPEQHSYSFSTSTLGLWPCYLYKTTWGGINLIKYRKLQLQELPGGSCLHQQVAWASWCRAVAWNLKKDPVHVLQRCSMMWTKMRWAEKSGIIPSEGQTWAEPSHCYSWAPLAVYAVSGDQMQNKSGEMVPQRICACFISVEMYRKAACQRMGFTGDLCIVLARWEASRSACKVSFAC